jgi:hypothetical protein
MREYVTLNNSIYLKSAYSVTMQQTYIDKLKSPYLRISYPLISQFR